MSVTVSRRLAHHLLLALLGLAFGCGEGVQSAVSDVGTQGSGALDAGQHACFRPLGGAWSLPLVSGGSLCGGWAPVDCTVSSKGCSVTIDCTHFGSMTVVIDDVGLTTASKRPLGDGVVADCHAKFSTALGTTVGDVYSMRLSCAAQGVVCEFGSSRIFQR